MSINTNQWLSEANTKYESCAYACNRGLAGGCALDGYPILDCPGCKAYKQKESTSAQKEALK